MSGIINWFAEHVAGTTTSLQFVDTVEFSKGRRTLSDDIEAGQGSIWGSRPDLLPTVKIGDQIVLKLGSPPKREYSWAVTDLNITYDIVQKRDRWEIKFEDAIARLSRGVLGLPTTVSWAANATTEAGAREITKAIGLGSPAGNANSLTKATGSNSPRFNLQARTFDATNQANALERLAILAATEQAAVYADYDRIYWTNLGWQSKTPTATFTDSSLGTDRLRYTRLEFSSLAETYYDRIQIKSTGISPDRATGTGTRTKVIQTDIYTAAQADDLAGFVFGIYSNQAARPIEIHAIIEGQATGSPSPDSHRDKLYALIEGKTTPTAEIIFRGTTYRVIIEGFEVRADPTMTEVTFYLTSGDAYNFFVLDDDTFGVLGVSRIGITVNP